MWHPSRSTRLVLGVVGVLVVLAGMAGRSLETEYGGDGPGEMEVLPDGTAKVYDIDDQHVDGEGHPVRVLVFEGTLQEAEAWAEERAAGGRSYLGPNLIMAIGAVLLGGAMLPSVSRSIRVTD